MATVILAVVMPVSAAPAMPPIPTPQFRSYGLHEGLPSSKVHAVVQDRRGFLWVGTSVGLARFDGVAFTTPRIGADLSHPMPAGAVTTLLVDHDDRVWMGGADMGLARYDPRSGGFVQWHDGLADDDVRAIAQSADGSLWIGTARGLDRMRTDGSGLTHLRGREDGVSSNSIRALHATPDGRLWVGSDGGLDVVSGDGVLRRVPFPDGPSPVVHGIEGRDADLRVATDRGLYVMTNSRGLQRDRRVLATGIASSLSDSHGSVWVAGTQGLSLLDRQGRLHEVPAVWTALGGLPGRSVRRMFEDSEHGLWFALSDGGLAYLGPAWDDFTRFAHVATDPSSFPGRTVTAVAARGGSRLWVGGLRGWIRGFDPATGHTSAGFDIGPTRIQSLLALPGDRLLIGTAEGLLRGSDGRAHPCLRAAIDRPVTSMATAPDGTIYVAALGAGLYRIDPDLRRATPVGFAQTPRGWADTRQIEIVDGELWQASVAGLARRDAASGEMQFIEGVAPGRISAFEPDEDGFWVVRPDALEHYGWHGTHARRDRHVGGTEGFPAADILNLRRDTAGRLWLYGQTGVWRFDPGRSTFRPFGLADGLASGEFTNATTVLLDDGSMYGGTLGGLVGFRPDSQRDHDRRPAVVLLDASVSRDGVRRKLPLGDDVIHLGWNDRELHISARVMSYVNPERNTLDFILEHDGGSTVVHTGKAGEVSFDALRAGRFRLAIEGWGRDGLGASLPAPLTLVVDPPPWRRWWAWLGYGLIASGVLAAILVGARRRMRQSMRLRVAEAANAAKTEFMATLGHEIRTPMTGVLGMAELIAGTSLDDTQRGYVEAVRRSGATLLRLVNDALDITRIEARRLELAPECTSLRALADEVVSLAAAHAGEKGLALSATVADGVPHAVHADPVRLRQILQNLVNNAVKFTEQGSVTLHIGDADGMLHIAVSDTGPGMSDDLRRRLFSRFEQGCSPQRAQGSGLGLAICDELCRLMGGTIEAHSAPGQGSRFNVRLPLAQCACAGTAGCVRRALAGANGAGRRVLVVEDDPTVADVIVRLLRERGHTVTAVGDGLAAMGALGRDTFDVVLLDLDLPVLDGFHVARLIRRQPALVALRIVAVTARSQGNEGEAIRAAGMDALLRKPMSGGDLEALLAESPEVGECAHHEQGGG